MLVYSTYTWQYLVKGQDYLVFFHLVEQCAEPQEFRLGAVPRRRDAHRSPRVSVSNIKAGRAAFARFAASGWRAGYALAAAIASGGDTPESARARFGCRSRRISTAMAGVAPPASRLIAATLWVQSAARLRPINAGRAFHHLACRTRTLSTTVFGMRFGPMRHVVDPLARARGMTAAETVAVAAAIPETAIAAFAISLWHLELPWHCAWRNLSVWRPDHGSTALTRSSSCADQSPPSARIRPTLTCNLRVSTASARRCASSAGVCAVTTSR